MMSIPAKKVYPRTGDKQTVYLGRRGQSPQHLGGRLHHVQRLCKRPVGF